MERDKFFWLVLAVSVISFAYWFAFAQNALFTFHEYTDVSVYAWSMWYDIHFPQISHGLQLLVFGNHISPDNLLVLPFYYIVQSPSTLLFMQDLVITLAGVAIYFVTKDLLKNKLLAFIFFLAFVINPGMHGILIFDYHTELFLPLAYILTFYFIMKNNWKWSMVSLALLLGSIEEGPYIAMSLAAGILLYEFFLDKGGEHQRARMRLCMYAIIISIVVLAVYWLILSSLISGYASGAYANFPPALYAGGYDITQTGTYLGSISGALAFAGQVLTGPFATYTIYAVLLALLSFGITSLFLPLLTIWLQLPWLVATFVGENTNFLTIFNYYFAFALGPILVGSVLGMMAFESGKGLIPRLVARQGIWAKRVVYVSAIGLPLIFFALSPTFVYSKNVNNLSQDFLFHINSSVMQQTEQLYSVLNYLPPNASVMTNFFIMPHLINRQYLEILSQQWWFRPEYVLVDFNLNISLNAYTDAQNYNKFTQDNQKNYTVCAINGSAWLFVLDNYSYGCPGYV